METGSRGTFVISWHQTEVDGLKAPPRNTLGVGASWRWGGDLVRIDGPKDLLSLGAAVGEAEFRARAARRVRHVVGLKDTGQAGPIYDDPVFHLGFDVTDGYARYAITMIELGQGHAPLLLFNGLTPPADTDLWVIRANLEASEVNRVTDQPTGVICFTPGTRIRTDRGDIAIELIEEGDKIQTKDDGMQEVLWKGEKRISGARLFAMPELRPIRLRAGALGVDRPDDDLIVSPSHRMLVKGAKARALFNSDEVLVRAADLLNDRSVVRDLMMPSVTYVHLLMPRHEVVFANGLETESFHPAGEALDCVERTGRERLLDMMPEVGEDPMAYGDYARRALNRAEAAILADPRH